VRLEIDYKKITHSPYNPKDTDSFFTFTTFEVESLLNLIVNTNESSYYVSGYRGVGKTSFIKKVEEELTKKNGFVFIHVCVSKYDKYEIIIRNFIRQFYFQIIESSWYKDNKGKNQTIDAIIADITILNKQTFYEVNNENIKSESVSKTRVFNYELDIKELLVFLIPFFISIIAFSVDFTSQLPYKIILQIMGVIWSILQFVKMGFTVTRSKTKSSEHKETEKSFYDDDVAEYRFNNILNKLKESSDLKPVFIVDELDKMSVKEAKKVLHLFKSTLLSGNANFIVVGGQELYYELYSLNEIEDPILCTLFSKTIHVPLKSVYELRELFGKLVVNFEIVDNDEKKIAYDIFINDIVHESRRLPRKFISLIKNLLVFENGKAYIDISENYARPNSTEMLTAIENVVDRIKTRDNAIKDYIIINLYTEANKMMRAFNHHLINERINGII
jgi:Cdc6-like AAA superfamily ATPase